MAPHNLPPHKRWAQCPPHSSHPAKQRRPNEPTDDIPPARYEKNEQRRMRKYKHQAEADFVEGQVLAHSRNKAPLKPPGIPRYISTVPQVAPLVPPPTNTVAQGAGDGESQIMEMIWKQAMRGVALSKSGCYHIKFVKLPRCTNKPTLSTCSAQSTQVAIRGREDPSLRPIILRRATTDSAIAEKRSEQALFYRRTFATTQRLVNDVPSQQLCDPKDRRKYSPIFSINPPVDEEDDSALSEAGLGGPLFPMDQFNVNYAIQDQRREASVMPLPDIDNKLIGRTRLLREQLKEMQHDQQSMNTQLRSTIAIPSMTQTFFETHSTGNHDMEGMLEAVTEDDWAFFDDNG